MITAGGKKKEKGDVQSEGVCFPKEPFHRVSLALLEVAEPLPADG